eukprot:Nk52_evm9s1636 gene=Nk52_evmTU9s1636
MVSHKACGRVFCFVLVAIIVVATTNALSPHKRGTAVLDENILRRMARGEGCADIKAKHAACMKLTRCADKQCPNVCDEYETKLNGVM